MVGMPIRFDDVNRLVAAREPVRDERKQHPILFVVIVEERAHVTDVAELRTGKGNGVTAVFME
jgi:hypothetical protein